MCYHLSIMMIPTDLSITNISAQKKMKTKTLWSLILLSYGHEWSPIENWNHPFFSWLDYLHTLAKISWYWKSYSGQESNVSETKKLIVVDIVCELYAGKYTACCDTKMKSLYNDEWNLLHLNENHNKNNESLDICNQILLKMFVAFYTSKIIYILYWNNLRKLEWNGQKQPGLK